MTSKLERQAASRSDTFLQAEGGGKKELQVGGARITETLLNVRSSMYVIRFHSHCNPANNKLDYSHFIFPDEATLRLRALELLGLPPGGKWQSQD